MAFIKMSSESVSEMNRYIGYRCEDEGIVLTPEYIGVWMSENIHELKDKPRIDAYLLEKES